MIFVVGAGALHSFDVNGNPLQSVEFNPAAGKLTGGITLDGGKLFVTYAKRASAGGGVAAFNAKTLKPLMLHFGAFRPVVPGQAPADADRASVDAGDFHAIVFDQRREQFYVGTDRGVLTFDRVGRYLPQSRPLIGSVSSLALDSDMGNVWGVLERRTVVKFSENLESTALRLAAQGAPYRHGRGPIALAYCKSGNDDGAIAVVFAGKSGRNEPGAGQTYDRAGKPLGSPYAGNLVNPHAVGCSSRGEVFVATDKGLVLYDLDRKLKRPPGALQTMNDPAYGVLIAY